MNKDHVALIRGQNSREINNFLKNNPGVHLDLSGANLQDVELTNINLQNANLEETDFTGSTFDMVDFRNANLTETKFIQCILQDCKFGNKTLRGTLFHFAEIQDTQINESSKHLKLLGVDFLHAKLRNVNFDDTELGEQASFAGATMRNVTMCRSEIRKSFFQGISATKCYFDWSTFEDVNLKNFHCEDCSFEETKFLDKTDMERAQFHDCLMLKVRIVQVNAKACDFESSRMDNAELNDSEFYGANFSDVALPYANLSDSKFNHARFSRAIMKGIKINTGTDFQRVILNECQLGLSDRVNERVAISVLSKGIVHNAAFVNPVFGRKARDEAWIYQYEQDIKKQCPESFWSMSPQAWKHGYRNALRILWKWSSDYGRNIWLWAGWSILISMLFSVLFYSLGDAHFQIDSSITANSWAGWFKYVYYSIVTFTTLGFGDITPKTSVAMAVVMSEVVIGYVMLGGLISILANKLARRND